MQNKFYLLCKIYFLIAALTVIAACTKEAVLSHDHSTRNVLSSISNAVSETDVLTVVAQINLVTSEGYYPVRAVLIIKKPLYFRLELLPVMGPPDFFLSTTPDELKILLPGKGEVYQGKPTRLNLSRFLPWAFNVDEIVAILAGAYPPLAGDIACLYYPDGNALRIEMKVGSAVMQTVWVGPDNRLSKLERFDENGKLLYKAEFTDYEESSVVAGKIKINMADGVTSITVKYSDLKIEKARDLSIFDLPVPDGFKKIMMD